MSQMQFHQLRKQYDTFIYRAYTCVYEEDHYHMEFLYEIPGLTSFKTKWNFPAKQLADTSLLERLAFHMGLVEAISYYKLTCAPKVIVKCGILSDWQRDWWKKLFYKGLGEFQYRNEIVCDAESFVEIACESTQIPPMPLQDTGVYQGCIVPVGGGKDSVVSLELLKREDIVTYTVNGSQTTANVCGVCDHASGNIDVRRILDKQILELNAQGYLNGHIPFSAVVAFSTVITAHLHGRKFIALSNENSANESTVKDSFVNHQYSKSFEFEQDFTAYVRSMTTSDIHYFSLLRPIAEVQIAALFAGYKTYHPVFRSCNAGSKQGIWCCNCPKCLFVYIILSPFLSQEELREIFGEDLYEKEGLETYFRELAGIDENKPFECVGTRSEVVACLKDYLAKGGKGMLPMKYAQVLSKMPEQLSQMLHQMTEEHAVPRQFAAELADAVQKL